MLRKYGLTMVLMTVLIAECKTQPLTILPFKPADHIEYLASEQLKGRFPGTRGDSLSAHYIREQFISTGLELLFKDGYQPFPLITGVRTGNNNNLTINNKPLTLSSDFQPLGFSGNSKIASFVVFAGYGFNINEDSLKWNDYKEIDVRNKWVLAFRNDPDLDNIQSPFAMFGQDRYKAMTAADQGAAGLLLVNTTDYEKEDALEPIRTSQSISSSSIPVIQITRETANLILASSKYTIDSLEKIINKNHLPLSFLLETEINGTTDLKPISTITHNIAAVVKGSSHPSEYIVIGAHYDHLGLGGPESGSRCPDTMAIHPGADDNASGIAAMLKLAKMVQENPLPRSVLFVAFGAEESGLLGSRFFTENPPVPIQSIKMMVNLDMVGRLDSNKTLSIGGTETATELNDIIEKVGKSFDFNIRKNPEGTGPSDHASFYMQQIPVLFFTTGIHNEYHTPNDKASLINYNGLDSVINYAYQIITRLGNSIQSITFNEVASAQPNLSRRRLKATLGIIPDFSTQHKGVGVDGVRPAGPASKAGLQKGDVITAIDGNPVDNIYDYMFRLAKYRHGDRISVDIKRNNETIVFLINL